MRPKLYNHNTSYYFTVFFRSYYMTIIFAALDKYIGKVWAKKRQTFKYYRHKVDDDDTLRFYD